MKAITVEPKKPGTARFEEIPEPDAGEGSVLVEAVAVGVCGTDVEIVEGKYGWAPPGKTRLVLGHESLGRIIDPGASRSLKKGDLVVGVVRRPDPVPCPNCAVGESDMCRNSQYTERGIKEIDGFMSERWRIEPEYVMKIDPSLGILGVLIEPTTVITKALEQVVTIGQRSFWEPKTALVTGAGPKGRRGRHPLPCRSRIGRDRDPGRRRCRGGGGPEEQCDRRQRECEQAPLVQSIQSAGSRGPEVAEPPDYTP
ncbi:MAG: alcohol dehydrogenase catalytic domain-containing protein [Candidatus Manganitrophus sp. SB1]|nr:alcohol dehydrogenase catalytic domain-containing protein [Candidatus Manganitrophus morganii]